MNSIKSKWRLISLFYFVAIYLLFIVIMDQGWTYLFLAYTVFIVISLVLFLGTFIGLPGLLVQSFFKKEAAAARFYSLAYQFNTSNTNILAAYGLYLLRQEEVALAKEVFEKALKSSSHYLYTKTLKANLCICDWKLGNTSKAYTDYLALYYYPDREEINDFSLDNLEEGSQKNPHFYLQDFITLGYLASLEEKYKQAIYFTHLALDLDENNASAYDNLGQIAYAMDDIDTAKSHFKKALSLKPGLVDSLYYLALIYADQGKKDKAKELVTQALQEKITGLNTVSQEALTQLSSRLK